MLNRFIPLKPRLTVRGEPETITLVHGKTFGGNANEPFSQHSHIFLMLSVLNPVYFKIKNTIFYPQVA